MTKGTFEGFEVTVTPRPAKTFSTLIDKLRRPGSNLSSVQDVAGLRIVGSALMTLSDQDRLRDVIVTRFPRRRSTIDARFHRGVTEQFTSFRGLMVGELRFSFEPTSKTLGQMRSKASATFGVAGFAMGFRPRAHLTRSRSALRSSVTSSACLTCGTSVRKPYYLWQRRREWRTWVIRTQPGGRTSFETSFQNRSGRRANSSRKSLRPWCRSSIPRCATSCWCTTEVSRRFFSSMSTRKVSGSVPLTTHAAYSSRECSTMMSRS